MAHDDFQAPRLSEEAIASLATLPEMEWRTSILRVMLRQQDQIDQNTEITADTQEVLNRDVKLKVDAIFEIVEPVRAFFRSIGKWGARIGAAAEWTSQSLRRYWWLYAALLAGITYWRTGRVPDWVLKLIVL